MKILIVEDDPSARNLAEYNLGKMGHACTVASDGCEALKILKKNKFDVILTDVKMPCLGGLELLEAVRKTDNDTMIIIMTAFGDIEMAVKAMKAGAWDFITKPFSRDYLGILMDKAAEHLHLRQTVKDFEKRLEGVERQIIYSPQSPMTKIISLVDRVSNTDHTVLITGESGTGKELIARRIHARSPFSKGPFVAVNCGAIPAGLMESELFGHRKGAFTGATENRNGRFQSADGGSLFLDEISELDYSLQTRLLRVLAEGEVAPVGSDKSEKLNVRVIAATNRDLSGMISTGSFREDLYFRLNVINIDLPPLRQRREDIAVLFRHFISIYSQGRSFRWDAEFEKHLTSLLLPGNVRELENLAKRLTILSDGEELTRETLEMSSVNRPCDDHNCPFTLTPEGFGLLDLEKHAIWSSLEYNRWNVSKTAEYLKVPRYFLAYRMEKYGIKKP
ncbi:sigma-54 dependent transcriptional regulator [Myxococcota bacterium]|nr:sigma-54 dependent transcriptional regulator [Myxococcota bacterium]MBU1381081.1 sigma-54 dependent transcriptional regulator [Myxococcota bacterium]MBU1496327.1 sigma-54 dependent transcriptional regulator [Myxococcota bacterium]